MRSAHGHHFQTSKSRRTNCNFKVLIPWLSCFLLLFLIAKSIRILSDLFIYWNWPGNGNGTLSSIYESTCWTASVAPGLFESMSLCRGVGRSFKILCNPGVVLQVLKFRGFWWCSSNVSEIYSASGQQSVQHLCPRWEYVHHHNDDHWSKRWFRWDPPIIALFSTELQRWLPIDSRIAQCKAGGYNFQMQKRS